MDITYCATVIFTGFYINLFIKQVNAFSLMMIGFFSALYATFPPVLLNYYGFCANAGYILVLVIGSISLLLFHSNHITPRKWKIIGEFLLFVFGIWIHPVMFYYIGAITVVWITEKLYQNNHVTIKSSKLIIISFVLSVFLFIILIIYILYSKNQLYLTIAYIVKIANTTIPAILGIIPYTLINNFMGVSSEVAQNFNTNIELYLTGIFSMPLLGRLLLIKTKPLLPIFLPSSPYFYIQQLRHC
jgi:hypothetical protein